MDDLIDRAALLADIERDIENSGCVNHEREIMDCVRYAPTVDAEIVRHGRWMKSYRSGYVPKDGKPICSECDCWAGGRTNYCPHCGAKMGEQEDKTNDGRAD